VALRPRSRRPPPGRVRRVGRQAQVRHPGEAGRPRTGFRRSGAKPTKRLEELDLAAAQIPEPGWATFLPGNWKIEVVPAMDEVMWRWSLERWRREVIDPPTGDRDDEPDR
jgi:hypothetical protein